MNPIEFFFGESLSYSTLSALILTACLLISLWSSEKSADAFKRRSIGAGASARRKLVKRALLSVGFVTVVTQAAYFSLGTFKEGWDAATATFGVLMSIIIAWGVIVERRKSSTFWRFTAVRYTLYAFIPIIAIFASYLASHQVDGVLLWTNAGVWLVFVVWGLVPAIRAPSGRLAFGRLLGWMLAACALICHVATLVLVTR